MTGGSTTRRRRLDSSWTPSSTGVRTRVIVRPSPWSGGCSIIISPAGWEWPRVPVATSCSGDREYGHCLEGMPRDFYSGVERDKVGELGMGYALFY